MICGADDVYLRVFNYNTTEEVKKWEAHLDYIRAIAVHPTQSYVLSGSDDMTIKLWDWENACVSHFDQQLTSTSTGNVLEFLKAMNIMSCQFHLISKIQIPLPLLLWINPLKFGVLLLALQITLLRVKKGMKKVSIVLHIILEVISPTSSLVPMTSKSSSPFTA